MDQKTIETILGRNEWTDFIRSVDSLLEYYMDERILITGGNNSLGISLASWFDERGLNNYFITDINIINDISDHPIFYLNVSDPESVSSLQKFNPTTVFHLAAPNFMACEVDPVYATIVNIDGTNNICNGLPDAHVIYASSLKAVRPQTVFGATQMIAEKIVVNSSADGVCPNTVMRLSNIIDYVGNVFDRWENESSISFAYDARRYYMTMDEAVASMIFIGASSEGGRYTFDSGFPRYLPKIASDIYGGDKIKTKKTPGGVVDWEYWEGDSEETHMYAIPIYAIHNRHDVV